MWTRAQLKELGKSNFKRVYKQAVIVCIIVYLISSIFDGGYNAADNGIQTSIDYNYNQSMDANSIYENEVIEDDLTDIAVEGVAAKLFENIFDTMINFNSGVSAAAMAVVAMCIMIAIIILRIFILNPIKIGKNNFFMGIRENERKVGDILYLFDKSKFIKPSITMLFMDLFTFLWTLLLIIPGIVKSYEYYMIPYILSENPGIDRKRAFELSKEMMYGQKWDTFILELSFMGWVILSSITFGILGIFYVNPYAESTYAELYAVLRDNAIQSGITDTNELPGFDF